MPKRKARRRPSVGFMVLGRAAEDVAPTNQRGAAAKVGGNALPDTQRREFDRRHERMLQGLRALRLP
jgi:hypothetical protein